MTNAKGICFNEDGDTTRKFRVNWWITDDECGQNFCIVYVAGKKESAQILIPVRAVVAELKREGYINPK
jgi:hypothetical protein